MRPGPATRAGAPPYGPLFSRATSAHSGGTDGSARRVPTGSGASAFLLRRSPIFIFERGGGAAPDRFYASRSAPDRQYPPEMLGLRGVPNVLSLPARRRPETVHLGSSQIFP